MADLYKVINVCKSIMNIPINLSGYNITLFQVVCWSFVAGICLYFIYSLFK